MADSAMEIIISRPTYVASFSSGPGLEPKLVSPIPLKAEVREETFPAGRVGVAKLGLLNMLGTAENLGVVPGGGAGLLGPARERAGVVNVFNLSKPISICMIGKTSQLTIHQYPH